jgi:hypothetical protein
MLNAPCKRDAASGGYQITKLVSIKCLSRTACPAKGAPLFLQRGFSGKPVASAQQTAGSGWRSDIANPIYCVPK